MRPLPPELRRLLLMGGTLNPNWALGTATRKAFDVTEASTATTGVHADVSKLCTAAAAKDDVLITGRFGTVSFAKRLTEHVYDEFGKKKRNKRPKIMKQTKDSSDDLLRTKQLKRLIAVPEAAQQKAHGVDGEKPRVTVAPPKDVYSSYLEEGLGHSGSSGRKGLLHLTRENRNLGGEPGDVWFQMQKNGQGAKEAHEIPFAAPYYPPHLNPKLADVPTAKEAAREHAQNKLFACAMKTAKTRLDIRTYLNGLTTESAKTHFPVNVDYNLRGPAQLVTKKPSNLIEVPQPADENDSHHTIMQSSLGGAHAVPTRKSFFTEVSNNNTRGALAAMPDSMQYDQSPRQHETMLNSRHKMTKTIKHTQENQSQQETDKQEEEEGSKRNLTKSEATETNRLKETNTHALATGGSVVQNTKSVSFGLREVKLDDNSSNATKKLGTRSKHAERKFAFSEPKSSKKSNVAILNKAHAFKLPKTQRFGRRRSIVATIRELDYENPGLMDSYVEWSQNLSSKKQDSLGKSSLDTLMHRNTMNSMDGVTDTEVKFEASEKHCW
nr:unnamed protein product [Spirometra erinaceieuropaei]